MSAIKSGKVDTGFSWEGLVEQNLITYPKHKREGIYASNSSLCQRQTAGLQLLSFSPTKTRRQASAQFYFKIGSAIEKVMERALKKSGKLIGSEVYVQSTIDELPVSGRIDFVVNDPEDDILLVELKSCGKLPNSPKPYQLAQLHTYMLLTGVHKGLLWYVSRHVAGWDGGVIQRAFKVEPTQDVLEHAALQMIRGAVAGNRGVLPPIPAHMKKYKCGFCPLVPFCWDNEDVGLKFRQPKDGEVDEMNKEIDQIYNDLIGQQDSLQSEFKSFLSSIE